METKICEYCGKEYIARQFNQKYCSKQCCKKAEYKKEIAKKIKLQPIKCEVCGKEFTPKTKAQVICGSESCKKIKAQERSRKFKEREKEKKNNIKQNIVYQKCIICGEDFIPKNPLQKVCDKEECKLERNYRYRKGVLKDYFDKNADKYSFKKINQTKICPVCKNEFVTTSWNQIYCSRKCREEVCKSLNPNSLMYEKECIICGKKFYPNSSSKLTCSDKCSKELSKIRANKRKENKHKVEYDIIKCQYCGEYFKPKTHNQKFCNKEHQELYYKEHNIYSIMGKEWYIKNRDKVREQHKIYYLNNKEKTLIRGYKNRARRKSDPDYVLKNRIRNQVRDHLKRSNIKKSFHTFELLGYTVEDLRNRLESLFEQNSKSDKETMSWENMGTLWHIDHIKPCASFTFINEDGSINEAQIKECWSLDNLQPLYGEDNVSKSSWYDGVFYKNGKPI